MFILLLLSCGESPVEQDSTWEICTTEPAYYEEHPSFLVWDEERQEILSRLEREPYTTLYTRLTDLAEQEYTIFTGWDADALGDNASLAQAAAFLGWLHDDVTMQEKAKSFLLDFPSTFSNEDDWDVNIRMPAVLIGAANTYDFLMGVEALEAAEQEQFRGNYLAVSQDFYSTYVLDDSMRQAILGYAQNNHPIRTAAALGYASLVFPDAPETQAWRDFATSELSYLWSEEGQYIQADGGVSEGPFYFNFGFSAAIPFFLLAERRLPADACSFRRCDNRQEFEPWQGHGCVENEPFRFADENPLHGELVHHSVLWSMNLRLPGGDRYPVADAKYTGLNGAALLQEFGGQPAYSWDWQNMHAEDLATTWGLDNTILHLVRYDDQHDAVTPSWKSWIMEDAGFAAFRSGWLVKDMFGALIAEKGAMRKTLHDQVDSLSIGIAAYGEFYLIDPGYYKETELSLPETAQAISHNVILIDGEGAPEKGALFNFGDADASLRAISETPPILFAEASQSYQQSHLRRGMAFVDERYFVVVDRLETEAQEERLHSWRMHPYVGDEIGGELLLLDDGIQVTRNVGGIRIYLASTQGELSIQEQIRDPEVENKAPHVHRIERQGGPLHHRVVDGQVVGLQPSFLSLIIPVELGDDLPKVEPIDAGIGAVAWRVERSAGWDIIWLREPEAATKLIGSDGSIMTMDANFGIFLHSGETFFHGDHHLDE